MQEGSVRKQELRENWRAGYAERCMSGSEGSAVVRYYREEGVTLTIEREVPAEIDKSSCDF